MIEAVKTRVYDKVGMNTTLNCIALINGPSSIGIALREQEISIKLDDKIKRVSYIELYNKLKELFDDKIN